MKILFYSHTGKVSGAENVLLLALKYLNRARFVPTAVCPPGDLAQKIEELKVPCATAQELKARFTWRPDLLAKYLFSFFETIKQLRNEILKAAPDLVHANSVRAGLAATAATFGTKIPVNWHVQDELPLHLLSTLIRLFVLFSPRVRIVAASQATLESFRGKLLRRFGKNVLQTVVHNGIEPEKFQIEPANRCKIRQELQLSEDEFIVGMVGQITPRKGQLEAIKTFADLQEKNPNSTLLIAGVPMFNQDHEYYKKLEETVEKFRLAEKVKFLGLRRDVPALMQAFDVLLVNSKSEAFVVVAIEAMACGTPVIATDVGGTREMIQHKVNGWLIPFGDAKKLREALIECAANPALRQRFAEVSRRVVLSRLTATKFIRDLEDFFVGEGVSDRAQASLQLIEN